MVPQLPFSSFRAALFFDPKMFFLDRADRGMFFRPPAFLQPCRKEHYLFLYLYVAPKHLVAIL